jgi:hypothetical protein
MFPGDLPAKTTAAHEPGEKAGRGAAVEHRQRRRIALQMARDMLSES